MVLAALSSGPRLLVDGAEAVAGGPELPGTGLVEAGYD